MNKAAIVYFSGTGNTKYVANIMKGYFNANNIECDLIDIEKKIIDPLQYDYIMLGGPVYAERYPEIFLKYIERNIYNYNGKCMMFATQASSGVSPVFQHALKRLKNLNSTYYNFIPMPNNFYNFMFKKYTNEEEKRAIEAASKKVRQMVREFLQGKESKIKISNFRVQLAEVGYKMTYPYLRKWLMKKLSIDRDKCVKCGLCEISCPTNSITIGPSLKIKDTCTFCQRCLNICPKNAFLYKGKNIDQYKPNFKQDIMQ